LGNEQLLPVVDSLRREFSFFKGNYAIIVISWILIDFAFELPGTYYALYVLELGATETIIGMIGLVEFLALASMQFPGGYLADKFGRKWLISSMTFGVAFCYILYMIAPSWHFILIGAVLLGLVSIYDPAVNAIVADSLPPERRGMGYGLIMLILSATTTPGPFVAGILYNQFGLVQGMRIGYGLVVVLWLIAAFLRLRLKETIAEARKPSLNELLHAYPIALKESFRVWKKVPRSMFYLLLSFVSFHFGWAVVQLYLVVYAVQELSITETVWPLILTALFVTMIVLAVPMGKVVDKFNRKIPLLISYLAAMVALWLFVTGDLLRLFFSLAIFGVAIVIIDSAYSALEADLTPKEHRGKVTGFRYFSTYIMMAIGSLVGGMLFEHFSPQLPFFLAIISFIPPFILTLTMVHEPEKREE
jgi:MFS family permease